MLWCDGRVLLVYVPCVIAYELQVYGLKTIIGLLYKPLLLVLAVFTWFWVSIWF